MPVGRKPKYRKGGRPKSLNPRTKRITINCTENQLNRINEKVNYSRLSMSEYLLRAALDVNISKGITKEELDTIKMLRSYSNNLNQIAKKINSMNPTDKLGVQIMINLDEISSMISMVKKNIDIKGRGSVPT